MLDFVLTTFIKGTKSTTITTISSCLARSKAKEKDPVRTLEKRLIK